MKQKFFALLMVLMMTLSSAALADDGLGSLLTEQPAVSAEQALAEAAVTAEVPGATIHYAIQERDDGRLEWKVFFSTATELGEAEVLADTYEVRKLKTYALTDGALTADKAVESLMAAKGALTVRKLDLERDDGWLIYEGEAELNGKRYDFEMTADGRVIEWERD